MAWNPDQYHIFTDHRLRPALDLMAQLPPLSPAVIYDLGCGSGNVTAHLSLQWNRAVVTGIDSSAQMLSKARDSHPAIEWTQGDIAAFNPLSKGNLIFSNAALHWLDSHETLFPHLMAQLHPGGVLAVQMPSNFGAPSHQLLYELAASARWRDQLGPEIRSAPVKPAEYYYNLLAPMADNLNIWQTSYLQALDGEDAVLEWVRGTALLPFIGKLNPGAAAEFEQSYRALLADAYPVQQSGKTLFPFSRLFIIVQAPE